jgi:hypothetical protein
MGRSFRRAIFLRAQRTATSKPALAIIDFGNILDQADKAITDAKGRSDVRRSHDVVEKALREACKNNSAFSAVRRLNA